MARTAPTSSRRPAVALAGAAAVLCTLIALVLAATAPGKAADILGNVGGKAPPSCPTPKSGSSATDPKFCQAIASVTGFQMVGHGKRAALKVPKDGRIVAWSVDISEPSADEQNSFISTFKFGQPTARIAVLKPGSKSKFRLAKQSPKVDLTAELGTKPIFTLKSPLRVKKGSVIAISTANWIPNLAHDGALTANGDKWRASRSRKKCGTDPNKTPAENKADILASKPQKKVGTTRTYGCTYTASRLLYQAYYVPNGK